MAHHGGVVCVHVFSQPKALPAGFFIPAGTHLGVKLFLIKSERVNKRTLPCYIQGFTQQSQSLVDPGAPCTSAHHLNWCTSILFGWFCSWFSYLLIYSEPNPSVLRGTLIPNLNFLVSYLFSITLLCCYPIPWYRQHGHWFRFPIRWSEITPVRKTCVVVIIGDAHDMSPESPKDSSLLWLCVICFQSTTLLATHKDESYGFSMKPSLSKSAMS